MQGKRVTEKRGDGGKDEALEGRGVETEDMWQKAAKSCMQSRVVGYAGACGGRKVDGWKKRREEAGSVMSSWPLIRAAQV